MAMTIGGSYGVNPYAQYNTLRSPEAASSDEKNRQENQAIALSEELASSVTGASVPVNSDNQDDKPRVVEAETGAEGMQRESMDRKNSSIQLDMMDLQAAFFGFSSRRATDIPAVSFS